jgi:hypothetical protein
MIEGVTGGRRGKAVCAGVFTAALLCAAAAPAGADQAYAPLSRPGPQLSVAKAKLRASLDCEPSVRNADREPVLLNPATGVTPEQNYSWNWELALDRLEIPWCAYTAPGHTLNDIQVSGEYLVHAIRRMHAMAGRRIAILGHSQGGMSMRWALRFWPDTRPMVDDVIGFAPSNHGTKQAGLSCMDSCIYANWQQSFESNFIRALNSFAETWPGISYTSIYSHNDEIVTPNSDDTGSSSLHTGSGAIRNVAIQDVCPNDPAEHFLIGTTDAVAYELAMDALTHAGPADPARVPISTCAEPYMPGIDPAVGPAAGLQAFYNNQSSTGPESSSEPPLACYVFASCKTSASNTSATCPSTRSIRFRLRGRRYVRVDVYLDGKRIRHKRGHRIRSVSIGRLKAGRHTIKVVSVAASGGRHVSVRKVRGCKLTKPRTRHA